MFCFFFSPSGMRKGTQTFLPTYLLAFVWRKVIMLLLANAGTWFEWFSPILVFFVSLKKICLTFTVWTSGHCRRQLGSMCWRSFRLDPRVVERRLLLGFKLWCRGFRFQYKKKNKQERTFESCSRPIFDGRGVLKDLAAVWILIWIWTVFLLCSICSDFLSNLGFWKYQLLLDLY